MAELECATNGSLFGHRHLACSELLDLYSLICPCKVSICGRSADGRCQALMQVHIGVREVKTLLHKLGVVLGVYAESHHPVPEDPYSQLPWPNVGLAAGFID